MKRSLCLLLVAGAFGCTSVGQIPTARLANGALRTANGVPAGTVVVLAAGDEVTINLVALGLPAGTHGVHLHMVGSCDGPAFASAGGHLNPHAMKHGTDNPAGSHLGDLPNLVIDSRGSGTLSAKLRDSRAATEAELFDADGTALVVHADADDYKTDPSGNSGTRIACAVLKHS
jgi:Cu-Zn family superoxide dismutase